MIRVKGDGKNYQFRVKPQTNQHYSYICEYKTTGDWQTVQIPFNTLYPSFRGQTHKQPDYPCKKLSEICFLIGNKKAETFLLEIARIVIE